MNTRSTFKKLLALIIALSMVMPVASVAMAVQIVETFTVTFQVEGQADTTQRVMSGDAATEPANPSIPAGKSSFIGWFLSGVQQTLANRYNFATPINADTTLVAGFSDKWLVEFFNADSLVIDSKLVANGGTVTATDVSVTPPANMIFVDWRVQGAATAYSFATLVTSNLKLYPHFANTFYVYFISKGSTVNHQIVVDGAKATKPTDPTRAGYTFSHWSLTDGGAAFNFTTTPITANTTLYGVWTAQTVNYTVVYWLEKPNVSGDPGMDFNNYMFNKSETKQAPAGSTVSGTSISLSTINYAQFHHGATVTVAGNGTSVLNVYFNRIVYTLMFNLDKNSTTMAIGGTTYAHPATYSIQAKYEQSIGDVWPTSPNAVFTGSSSSEKFQYWKPDFNSELWVTKRLSLTSDMIPSSGTSYTLKAEWRSDLVNKTVNYWFEQFPGQTGGETRTYNNKTYVKSTAYSQNYADALRNGLNPKAINGVTYYGSDNKYVGGVGYVNEYNFFYKRNIHDLKFNSQGGSSVATVEDIMFEQPVAGFAPANPTRAGYTFKGWYLEAEYHTLFNFATTSMPNSDVMLFAKWESSQYTARFHSSLGGEVIASQGIAQDAYVNDPNLFTIGESYAGYGVFLGWYWYLPGTSLLVSFNWETPAPGDMDLYARWRTNGLTVTYNAGAGTGTVPVDLQTYDLNVQALVASGPGLTAPAGKVFVGWQVGGAGVTYYPGTTVIVNGNITLVARYIDPSNALALTFDSNYEVGEADVSWTVEKNVALNLAGTIFTRPGYTLLGWADNAIDTVAAYALGSAFTPTAAKTFYAVWQQDTVTVTFDTLAGGTLSGTELIQTVPAGALWSQINIPTTTPDLGYLFDGWYVGETSAVFPATVTTNLTYTAHWTKCPSVDRHVYIVDYTVTGGSSNYNNLDVDVTDPSTLPVIVALLTENGKTFSGWNPATLDWAGTQAVTSPEPTFDGTNWVTTHTKTISVAGSFTAIEPVTESYYTVSYLLNGAVQTYAGYTATDAQPMPTAVAADASQQGYTFAGWFKEGTTVKLTALNQSDYTKDTVRSNVIPAGPGTAQITNNYYTLTLVGTLTKNVGTITYYNVLYTGDKLIATTWPSDVTNETDAPTIALNSTATKNGHTFNGWSPSALDWNFAGTSGNEYYDQATDSYITPITKTIIVTGTFTECAETVNKLYTVIYKADLNHDGTPEVVTMPGFSVNEVNPMPTGVAGAPAVDNGYTFGSWDQTAPLTEADFGSPTFEGVANSTQPGVGNVRTIKYTLTINGSVSKNETSENVYTVNYSVNNATAATVGAYQATQTGGSAFGAQSLPTVSAGYSITGWNIGGTNYTSTLPWPSTHTGSEVKLEQRNGNWIFVTYYYYTLNATATVSENAHGTASEYNLGYSVSGSYTDPTNGGALSASNIPANVINASSLPTLGGSPSIKGHTFAGWKQGANAISTAGDIVWVETHRTDLDTQNNRFVDVTIYTAAVVGTFTINTGAEDQWALDYTISGTPYTDPEGNALSISGEPADVPAGTTKPTLAGAPSLKGHTFSGWKQGDTVVTSATLAWGSAVTSYRYDSATDTFITISTYSATVQGAFTMRMGLEEKYNLTYSITGEPYLDPQGNALTIGNRPVNANNETPAPSLAGSPTLNGYSFSGWKQGGTVVTNATLAWGSSVTSYRYDNGTDTFITISTYSAAVTGSFASNGLEEKAFWNLTYTGDSALADAGTWPANLSAQISEPSITTLVPAKLGYTFSGWMQGAAVVTGITWTPDVQYTLNPTNNQFVKTTTYSATLNGTLTKNGSKTEFIYIVDYTVTGGAGDYSDLDVNVTDPATLPAIASNPSEFDKVFSGWTPASLNWDAVTPVVVNDVRFDSNLGLWINTSTKTINVSGRFTNVTHVYVYELTFTGPDGTNLPAMKSGTGSANAPVIGSETASLANHRFLGWSPAAIALGDYVENAARLNTSTDQLTVTHYFEASTQAQFIPTANAESYTLHYSLTSSVAGQPANPSDDGPSGSPIAPNNGNVPSTVGDYYFAGWSITSAGWVKVDERTETVDGVEITTSYYEATAEGFYTDMRIAEKTVYSLIYQGYASGMLFWPADVISSETQPVVGGTPYLAGYTFSGWTPSSIDWSAASVSTSFEVIYPAEGNPYILKTITNTVKVTASFTQDEIPTDTPEEEIPIGVPNTGSNGLIEIAAVLAALGTAIATAAVIRRRRDGE